MPLLLNIYINKLFLVYLGTNKGISSNFTIEEPEYWPILAFDIISEFN